jgi:autoinducer 2 (AI-2) kinase
VTRGEHVLAIDAGTGSCRAAVVSADGACVRLAAREWLHPAVPGVPGGRQFDTVANWELVAACVREALGGSSPDAIRALSTTSFRGGLVAFDTGGRALWACPNSDARADAQARALVEDGDAVALQARGGDWVSLTAPARLRWLRERTPEVWRRAATFGLVNDWLTQRLSGALVTDPSVGSSSGLFDVARRNWAPESLALCELDAGMVPEVVATGTVVGGLLPDAAAVTGLRAGTPVVAGGADTALALLGLGVTEAGACAALGGTFWQQTLIAEAPQLDPLGRMRTLCHAIDGQWLVEGIGFYCGLALRWFRDAFCQPEQAEAKRLGVDAYVLMERQAAAIPPGANGVVAILSNAMDARSWVHAAPAFAGMDLERPAETGKPAFVRAILESAAFVVRAHVEELERIAGSRIPRVRLAGGAARGALWPQIIADVVARELTIPDATEATVQGAALAAGVGAGWHPDLQSAAAARTTAPVRTVRPEPAAVARYDALYERWRRVYAAMLPSAGDGLLAPLWRAPGA